MCGCMPGWVGQSERGRVYRRTREYMGRRIGGQYRPGVVVVAAVVFVVVVAVVEATLTSEKYVFH